MRGEHEIWLLRANHVPLGPTQPVCGMIYFLCLYCLISINCACTWWPNQDLFCEYPISPHPLRCQLYSTLVIRC